MSYVENNLLPNEEIRYTGTVGWNYVIFVPAVWIVLGIILLSRAREIAQTDLDLATGLGFFVIMIFLIGGSKLINRLICKYTSEFVITNKRCVLKSGLIGRRVTDIALDKCEGLTFDQNILGRLLKYGTIQATTGGKSQYFRGLNTPYEFRNKLFQIMEEYKNKQ